MTRRLRAAWRLTMSVLHVLHGVAIVLTRFSALDAAQREARIQWWATKTLRTMGISLRVDGTPHAGGTLMVANHISWLDIMAVHAVCPRARFVSKADVRSPHMARCQGLMAPTVTPKRLSRNCATEV